MKTLVFLFLFTLPLNASAGFFDNNDKKAQQAMKSYVTQLTAQDSFLPVVYQGKVLKLKIATSPKYPDGFHNGVQNKGNLYTSCADFVDTKGNQYDVDFLVNKSEKKFVVIQPIIHSINGKKNPYDLSH